MSSERFAPALVATVFTNGTASLGNRSHRSLKGGVENGLFAIKMMINGTLGKPIESSYDIGDTGHCRKPLEQNKPNATSRILADRLIGILITRHDPSKTGGKIVLICRTSSR